MLGDLVERLADSKENWRDRMLSAYFGDLWTALDNYKRILSLRDIEPVHIAAYIEVLHKRLAAPSVKQALAAIRMLFDCLVVGQVLAVNPASLVRGPKSHDQCRMGCEHNKVKLSDVERLP